MLLGPSECSPDWPHLVFAFVLIQYWKDDILALSHCFPLTPGVYLTHTPRADSCSVATCGFLICWGETEAREGNLADENWQREPGCHRPAIQNKTGACHTGHKSKLGQAGLRLGPRQPDLKRNRGSPSQGVPVLLALPYLSPKQP